MPNRIQPCPDGTLKCVSTIDTQEYAAMAPVEYAGTASDAMEAIEAVVADYPRTKVVTREPHYLATVFRTKVLRFKDTVEFEVDDEAKLIHFRSESVPFAGSDLGANRQRMTEVRAMLVARVS